MLTIQNTNKILHKTLGKKNFYVARIEDSIIYDPMTFSKQSRYIFELSNRQYAITVTLEREPAQYNALGTYFTLHSSTGHKLYITGKEISNIDIFIDKLRHVALG
jgi:hypothetical protein